MKHITPIMVRDELWELCCFLWITHLRGTRANIYLIYSTFYPHSIHLPLTRQHLLSWHEPISFRDLLAFPHPVTCCSHSQCVTGRSDIKAGWWCNDNLRTLSVCSTGARAHTHTRSLELPLNVTKEHCIKRKYYHTQRLNATVAHAAFFRIWIVTNPCLLGVVYPIILRVNED